MPILERDNAQIYYEVYGNSESALSAGSIVFAHGAGGNAAIWFNQIAHFAPQYQVVVFDHRCFARSPTQTPLSVHQFRDDLLGIMDVLEIERAHLVGQSMGGFTVLRTTLDQPDRVASLTMSATSGGIKNPNPSPAFRALTTSSGRSTDGVKASMSAATASQPALMQLYESINNFNQAFSWEKLGTLLTPEDVVHYTDLKQVSTRTLFIAGNEDPLFPAEQLGPMAEQFPHGHLVVVEDAGHSPYFEQPNVFNQILAAHLEG